VSKSSDEIIKVKDEFTAKLRNLNVKLEGCKDKPCKQLAIGEVIEAHSKVITTINRVLSDTHTEFNYFENKNLEQDDMGTVEGFIPRSLKFIVNINQKCTEHGIKKMSVSAHSFDTIQRFINTFSDPTKRDYLKQEFVNNNISIDGFNQIFEEPTQSIKDRSMERIKQERAKTALEKDKLKRLLVTGTFWFGIFIGIGYFIFMIAASNISWLRFLILMLVLPLFFTLVGAFALKTTDGLKEENFMTLVTLVLKLNFKGLKALSSKSEDEDKAKEDNKGGGK